MINAVFPSGPNFATLSCSVVLFKFRNCINSLPVDLAHSMNLFLSDQAILSAYDLCTAFPGIYSFNILLNTHYAPGIALGTKTTVGSKVGILH